MADQTLKQDSPAPVATPLDFKSMVPLNMFQFNQLNALRMLDTPGLINSLPMTMMGQSMVIPHGSMQLPVQPVSFSSPSPVPSTLSLTASQGINSTFQYPHLAGLQSSFMVNSNSLPLIFNAAHSQATESPQPLQQKSVLSVLPEINVASKKSLNTNLKRKSESGQSLVGESCKLRKVDPSRDINKILPSKNYHSHIERKSSDLVEFPTASNSMYPDLSNIISNLPSGWKVVGLTDLSKASESKVEVNEKCVPPNVKTTENVPVNPLLASCNPGVVSVNLNDACQFSSPPGLNKEDLASDMKYSLQMDNIAYAKNSSLNTNKDKVDKTNQMIISNKYADNSHSSHVRENTMSISSKVDGLSSSDQQWTIVGITSLPAPALSSSITSTTEVSKSSISTSNNTIQKSKIGNVIKSTPVGCPAVVNSPQMSPQMSNLHAVNLNTTFNAPLNRFNASSSDLKPGNIYDHNTQDSNQEKMKWTVVGISGVMPADAIVSTVQSLGFTNTITNQSPISKPGTALLPAISAIPRQTQSDKSMVYTQSAGTTLRQNPTAKMHKIMAPQLDSNSQAQLTKMLQGFDATRIKYELPSSNQDEKTDGSDMFTRQILPIGKKPDGGSLTEESKWKVIGIAPLSAALPTSGISESSAHSFLSSLAKPASTTKKQSDRASVCSATNSSPFFHQNSIVQLPSNNSQHPLISSGVLQQTGLDTAVPMDLSSTGTNAPQQKLLQLFQNQLLTQCAPKVETSENQWNVVGVIDANNQISMLDSSNIVPTKSEINQSPCVSSTVSDSEIAEKNSPAIKMAVESDSHVSHSRQKLSDERILGRLNHIKRNSDWKICQFKNKELSFGRKQSKKNTVSHLLEMKRMQRRGGHALKSLRSYPRVTHNLSEKDLESSIFDKVSRHSKFRSLRSYIMNRKGPSSTISNEIDKINLRSGTQVPVLDYKSGDEKEKEEQAVCTADTSVCNVKTETENLQEKIVDDSQQPKIEKSVSSTTRPSINKRKSKPPRKMVTDLDYHPFYSSSDSN